MITIRSIGTALGIFALLVAGTAARSEDVAHEDLTPCPGSAPEPTQSAAWSVAFCNRTGHDVVIEFHDNDCPAKNWDRRGDVYQRTLRRGESKTLPLCYANEPPAKKPEPGIPTLRIPGGKGVVTTWNVVGDCGDRSKPLNLDARTFYDRGEYKTGIILLQYPSGASHCTADAAGVASAPAQPGVVGAASAQAAAQASAPTPAQPRSSTGVPAPVQAQPPVTAPAAIAAPSVAAPTAPSPAPASVSARATYNPNSGPPTLSVAVDAKDVVGRTVKVYAANAYGGPPYKCNFNLELTFTDGAGWNDKGNANITGTEGDAPIATRKYLKSVSKVKMTSSKCSPM